VYHLISNHPSLPEPPNGILFSKVEKQWRWSISFFQNFLNRKCTGQIFAYPDSAIGCTDTYLLEWLVSLGYPTQWEFYTESSPKLNHMSLLKSIKSWCFTSFYSYFFSSVWRMQNTSSVADLLCRNPQWWSPIMSTAYRVSIDSRMLDKTLCVVDESDMFLEVV